MKGESKIDRVREFISNEAKRFGANNDNEFTKSYIERNNTSSEALEDNGAFFGFIHPEEEISGSYHDFSFVIFPAVENKSWLVCLGIGSAGFKNDYELATYPGVRRLFSDLIDDNGYCKSDFSDIETSLPKPISDHPDLQHIKGTISRYSKVLPVCQIINDPENDYGTKIISGFLAAYARLREWPRNANQRNAIRDALLPFQQSQEINYEKEIEHLLLERKFIVLQGPPGSGKTYLAKRIANTIGAKVYLTQFHAEVSYSDFIYGIRPSINEGALGYKEHFGIFLNSLKYALEHTDERIVLIIDEINRANLANVLGPIFYLFEHKMDDANNKMYIAPNLEIEKLPENFYVVSTMNTADRSLAVVDFALRRRFAWYNIPPHIIYTDSFHKNDFLRIQEIFLWYANDSELNLQPGQAYFIASTDEEMKNRIEYEIFPLIKEYLVEGYLRGAVEEFNTFFVNRIGKSLFK